MLFSEWLGRSQHYRKDVLGLPSDDILQHIWHLKVYTSDSAWDVSQEMKLHCHKFNSTFVIFEDENGLYQMSWKQLKGCRGFVERPQLKPIGMIDYLIFPWELNDKPKYHHPLPRYRVTCLQDLETYQVRMDNVERRLKARIVAELDPMDSGTRGFCDMLFELCDVFPYLGKKRAELERLAFLDAVKVTDEDICFKWLDSSSCWITTPTVEDVQSYVERFNNPEEEEPISRCLVVPYEDCPNANIPIHAGGLAHLTFRDIPEWAWQQYERFKQHVHCVVESQKDALLSDQRVRYLMGALIAHEKDFKQKGNIRLVNGPSVPVAMNVSGDIEDLFATGSCPPCLRNVMQDYRERHYKDAERVNLVSQLKSGRVPLTVVHTLFHEDKSSWDYEYYYNAGYAARPCSDFILNARQNNPCTIHCPYANSASPQQSCMEEFQRVLPKKWRSRSNLKYPFQWFLWYFLRKG
jgi:hypothetical protein